MTNKYKQNRNTQSDDDFLRDLMDEVKIKDNLKKGKPRRNGLQWKYWEQTNLFKAIEQGASLEELAEAHGRTPGAIIARMPVKVRY